ERLHGAPHRARLVRWGQQFPEQIFLLDKVLDQAPRLQNCFGLAIRAVARIEVDARETRNSRKAAELAAYRSCTIDTAPSSRSNDGFRPVDERRRECDVSRDE